MTVCGLNWYNKFIESAEDKNMREGIEEEESCTTFTFGAVSEKALKKVILPVNMLESNMLLEVEVIDTDIPLLLSLKSMKEMGMIIDCSADAVKVGGKDFDVHTPKSGHYSIPVSELKLKKKRSSVKCRQKSRAGEREYIANTEIYSDALSIEEFHGDVRPGGHSSWGRELF